MTLKGQLDKLLIASPDVTTDNIFIENILHEIGYPNAIVVMGLVFLNPGHEDPLDINIIALMLLRLFKG